MYYVYILTNISNKVLYIGITNNLKRRLYEHKHKLTKGFSNTYNIKKLVYYEYTNDVLSVITREKQLKSWHREKKLNLIESTNPQWKDLSKEWNYHLKLTLTTYICHSELVEKSDFSLDPSTSVGMTRQKCHSDRSRGI